MCRQCYSTGASFIVLLDCVVVFGQLLFVPVKLVGQLSGDCDGPDGPKPAQVQGGSGHIESAE